MQPGYHTASQTISVKSTGNTVHEILNHPLPIFIYYFDQIQKQTTSSISKSLFSTNSLCTPSKDNFLLTSAFSISKISRWVSFSTSFANESRFSENGVACNIVLQQLFLVISQEGSSTRHEGKWEAIKKIIFTIFSDRNTTFFTGS